MERALRVPPLARCPAIRPPLDQDLVDSVQASPGDRYGALPNGRAPLSMLEAFIKASTPTPAADVVPIHRAHSPG